MKSDYELILFAKKIRENLSKTLWLSISLSSEQLPLKKAGHSIRSLRLYFYRNIRCRVWPLAKTLAKAKGLKQSRRPKEESLVGGCLAFYFCLCKDPPGQSRLSNSGWSKRNPQTNCLKHTFPRLLHRFPFSIRLSTLLQWRTACSHRLSRVHHLNHHSRAWSFRFRPRSDTPGSQSGIRSRSE